MTDITDPADIIGVELVDEAVIDVLVSEGAAAPVEIPRYYLLLPTVTPAGTWQVGGVDTGIKAVGVDGQSADPAEVARIAAEAEKAAQSAEKAAALAAAISEQTALMPKFKEYQMAYVDRGAFSGVLANSGMMGVKFAKPFSRKPDYFMALVDVTDTIVRIASVNNVTAEGFQVGLNYATSMRGVWYAAGVTGD